MATGPVLSSVKYQIPGAYEGEIRTVSGALPAFVRKVVYIGKGNKYVTETNSQILRSFLTNIALNFSAVLPKRAALTYAYKDDKNSPTRLYTNTGEAISPDSWNFVTASGVYYVEVDFRVFDTSKIYYLDYQTTDTTISDSIPFVEVSPTGSTLRGITMVGDNPGQKNYIEGVDYFIETEISGLASTVTNDTTTYSITASAAGRFNLTATGTFTRPDSAVTYLEYKAQVHIMGVDYYKFYVREFTEPNFDMSQGDMSLGIGSSHDYYVYVPVGGGTILEDYSSANYRITGGTTFGWFDLTMTFVHTAPPVAGDYVYIKGLAVPRIDTDASMKLTAGAPINWRHILVGGMADGFVSDKSLFGRRRQETWVDSTSKEVSLIPVNSQNITLSLAGDFAVGDLVYSDPAATQKAFGVVSSGMPGGTAFKVDSFLSFSPFNDVTKTVVSEFRAGNNMKGMVSKATLTAGGNGSYTTSSTTGFIGEILEGQTTSGLFGILSIGTGTIRGYTLQSLVMATGSGTYSTPSGTKFQFGEMVYESIGGKFGWVYSWDATTKTLVVAYPRTHIFAPADVLLGVCSGASYAVSTATAEVTATENLLGLTSGAEWSMSAISDPSNAIAALGDAYSTGYSDYLLNNLLPKNGTFNGRRINDSSASGLATDSYFFGGIVSVGFAVGNPVYYCTFAVNVAVAPLRAGERILPASLSGATGTVLSGGIVGLTETIIALDDGSAELVVSDVITGATSGATATLHAATAPRQLPNCIYSVTSLGITTANAPCKWTIVGETTTTDPLSGQEVSENVTAVNPDSIDTAPTTLTDHIYVITVTGCLYTTSTAKRSYNLLVREGGEFETGVSSYGTKTLVVDDKNSSGTYRSVDVPLFNGFYARLGGSVATDWDLIVGQTYFFIAMAPRRMYVAKDTRHYNFSASAVVQPTSSAPYTGIAAGLGATQFVWYTDTVEGSWGTSNLASSWTELPGGLYIVARNCGIYNPLGATVGNLTNRWTVTTDTAVLDAVDNEKINWLIDSREKEVIGVTNLYFDASGAITGMPLTYYVYLSNMASTVVDVYQTSGTTTTHLSYTFVAGSNLIAITDPNLKSPTNLPAAAVTVIYTYKGEEPAPGNYYYVTDLIVRPTSWFDSVIEITKENYLSILGPMSINNDLCIMAEMAVNDTIVPRIYVVQVSDPDKNDVFTDVDYKRAIDVASLKKGLTDMVVLNAGTNASKGPAFTTLAYQINRIIIDNNPFENRKKALWVGPPSGMPIGAQDTPNTIGYLSQKTLMVYGNNPAHNKFYCFSNTAAERTITLSDGSNYTVGLDGSFIAGMAAATNAAFDNPWQTLLKQALAGFDLIGGTTADVPYSDEEVRNLGSMNTVSVIPDGDKYIFIESITTEGEEISVENQKFYMDYKVLTAVNNFVISFVPISVQDGLALLRSVIAAVITQEVSSQMIAPYENGFDPRQDIEVFTLGTNKVDYYYRYWYNTRKPIKRAYGLFSVDAKAWVAQ